MHGINTETPVEKIQPDGVTDKDEGNEQQHGHHERKRQGDALEILVEGVYQRCLVHHLLHQRGLGQLGLHHLQAVGRDILRLQVHVDGNGNGGRFKHAQEIFSQQAGHLFLALLAGDVTRGPDTGNGGHLGLVGKSLLFGDLFLQKYVDLKVLLEVIPHLLGVYHQQGSHPHQEQDQGQAHHRRNPGTDQPAAHG